MSLATANWVLKLASGENLVHGLVFGGGYVWGVTKTNPCKLLKIDPANPGSYTVLTFPSDVNRTALDLIYLNNKVYIPMGGRYIIAEVEPSDLSYVEVVNEVGAIPNIGAGPHSLANDGTYIYLVALGASLMPRYALSGWARTELSIGTDAHAVRYDGSKLFVTYATSPGIVKRIDPSSFTIEESQTLDTGDNVLTDDFAFTSLYLWVGIEGAGTGIGDVLRILKTDLTSRTRIHPGIDASCYAVYYDGTWIWAAYNTSPGSVVRIDPSDLSFSSFQFLGGLNAVNEIVHDGSKVWLSCFTSPSKILETNLPALLGNNNIQGKLGGYRNRPRAGAKRHRIGAK